ncbi:MAG TPA: hypothetical protein VK824_00385 [Planctomycetota bacterium]|nr:hypothetical protein [Planctomycetota bacterium]
MLHRLLHGTHAHAGTLRRDCVILNFAPAWCELPDDVRAHLIRHSALPGPDEAVPARESALLPQYDGIPRDLQLQRSAPVTFEMAGRARRPGRHRRLRPNDEHHATALD